ncbi:5'/3'-nucleotidase SurE [bacterium]|nr:5'/3'-nucleotidase SurE [bacterium]
MNILLTNDDGIKSDWILGLFETLKFLGHTVTVVAPKENKSAVSHSVTLHKPIQVIQQGESLYAVDGTPVDCIYLAKYAILTQKPDLVISGINEGLNYGDDVIYSGTVGAAREAYMKGIPSIAVSAAMGDYQTVSSTIPKITPMLIELSKLLGDDYFFNVNIPNVENLDPEFHFSYLSKKKWEEEVSFLVKDHNAQYYAIGGHENKKRVPLGSDADILRQGKISVTPLTDNYTHYKVIEKLINNSF